MSLDLAIEAYADYRRLLAQLAARTGVKQAAELNAIAERIVRAVGAGTNGTGQAVADQAHIEQLVADLEKAIAEIRLRQPQVYREAFREVGRATVQGTTQVYTQFGVSSVDKIESAKRIFLQAAREDIWDNGYGSWVRKFDKAAEGLKDAMTDSMGRAQLNGWGQRELANDFLRIPEFQFDKLPPIGERGEKIFSMGGRLGHSDALKRRAHVIARTELNGTANQMHLRWTEEAGFTKYININSDPVADVCKAANAAGELTREEWANGLGIPPRHPNCDSGLLAVA